MERDRSPPFLPDFWQSVRLLLAGLLLFGAPAFLAIHLARRRGLDLPQGWGAPAVYVGTIWLGRRWTGRPWSSLLPVQPVRWAWLPGFAVATVGVVVVGHLLLAKLAPTSPILWIFDILLLTLGTFLLRRPLRASPRRSLTMGSP